MTKSQTQTDKKATYTLADVGCYVDGARGIYAIDAIVAIGRSHGFEIQEDLSPCSFAGYEFANDIEDECDSYMNDHYGVDGAYWGRNEQGDWGLWQIEE